MHKQRKHKTAKEQEDEGSLMKYDLPKHVNLTVLSASLQEELIGLFQSDAKEKTTLTNLEDLHLHNNLAKPSDIQFRDVVKLKEDVDMDTEALLMEETWEEGPSRWLLDEPILRKRFIKDENVVASSDLVSVSKIWEKIDFWGSSSDPKCKK